MYIVLHVVVSVILLFVILSTSREEPNMPLQEQKKIYEGVKDKQVKYIQVLSFQDLHIFLNELILTFQFISCLCHAW